VWLLIVVLIILLVFAAPQWPYARPYGYYPAGGLGLAILIILVLLLAGVL
jgi:hypothetical protein